MALKQNSPRETSSLTPQKMVELIVYNASLYPDINTFREHGKKRMSFAKYNNKQRYACIKLSPVAKTNVNIIKPSFHVVVTVRNITVTDLHLL